MLGALCAACSLESGALAVADAAADDGGVADVTSDSPQSVTDAASDAPPVDAPLFDAPPSDAPPSDAPPSDGRGERWCQSATHRFCVDFDDDTYGAGTMDLSPNGQVALDPDAFSAPYSMRASFTPTSADNRARIVYGPIAVGATVTFQAALRVDSVTGTGGLTYLFTAQDSDPNMYGVRLAVDGGGNIGAVLTGSGAPPPTILGKRPVGWFHAQLLLAPSSVTITIDGIAPKTLTWAASPPPNLVLKLGLVGNNGVVTTAHFDNVALD